MRKNISDDCTSEILYIGMRIAYFRKLKNMTQADLAGIIHINKNYLSQIESGSANKVISLPLLIKISRTLEVKLSTLVDLTDLENSDEFYKDEIRMQMEEVKMMYEQMKEITAGMVELDKIMDDLSDDKNIS